MLNLLLHGGDLVSADNLSEVLNWYKQKTSTAKEK